MALIEDPAREHMLELLQLTDLIDLAIPRGGEGLIRFVAEHARVPVIKHYKGVCHLYVDRAADPELATRLLLDGKASRPGVCNALETLLVHARYRAALPARGAGGAGRARRRGARRRAHAGFVRVGAARDRGRLRRRIPRPDPRRARGRLARRRARAHPPLRLRPHRSHRQHRPGCDRGLRARYCAARRSWSTPRRASTTAASSASAPRSASRPPACMPTARWDWNR